MIKDDELTLKMTAYEEGCPKRIHHFLKVYAFSDLIGTKENVDMKTMDILRTASLVHDIGIKPSLIKYNDSKGPNQEKEGPPLAEAMLRELDYPEDIINRVSFLVGHHHTYDNIDNIDYQILVEADFLVNIFENNVPIERIKEIYEKHFVTETGKTLMRQLYNI